MFSSTKSLLFPLVAVFAATSSSATPLPHGNEEVDVVARGMMGTNNMLVSWESVPNKRSPTDPELEDLSKRIVYNPKILEPAAGSVWCAGETQTIHWDLPDFKEEYNDLKGTVKLGYELKNDKGGLNLQSPDLAKGFHLKDKQANVTVPAETKEGDNYLIVLMGDSGNSSPLFTIHANGCKSQEAPKSSSGDEDNESLSPLSQSFTKELGDAVSGE